MIIFLHPLLSFLSFFFTLGAFSISFSENRLQCALGKVRFDTVFREIIWELSCQGTISALLSQSLHKCTFINLSGVNWVTWCCFRTSGKESLGWGGLLKLFVLMLRGCNENMAVTHTKWLWSIHLFVSTQTTHYLLLLQIRGVWQGCQVQICYCSHIGFQFFFSGNFWQLES